MKNTTLLLVLLTLTFNLFSQQTKSPFVYNNVKLGEFKIVEGMTSANGVPIKSAYNNPKTIFIVLDSIISDSLISEIKKSYPNTTVKYNDSITNYLTLNKYTQDQYLIQSGQIKNASVAVNTATVLISSTLALNGKYKESTVVSIVGGGIAFVLNVVGNNHLINAGKRSR